MIIEAMTPLHHFLQLLRGQGISRSLSWLCVGVAVLLFLLSVIVFLDAGLDILAFIPLLAAIGFTLASWLFRNLANKTPATKALRVVLLFGVFLLVMVVGVPNFVKARITTSGGDYTFRFRILDEKTGQPVSGALITIQTPYLPAGTSSDDPPTVSGTNGVCVARGGFPTAKRTFTGGNGRLTVSGSVTASADGYSRFSNDLASLAGKVIPYAGTGDYTIKLTRQ